VKTGPYPYKGVAENGVNPTPRTYGSGGVSSTYYADQANKRVREDREHWQKVHALTYNETTPELEQWMEAKRWKTIRVQLTTQLEKARRKGSKKTLIDLDTVEKIIGAML